MTMKKTIITFGILAAITATMLGGRVLTDSLADHFTSSHDQAYRQFVAMFSNRAYLALR